MKETRLWIILAVVLGSLVLALAVVFVLFCWRRSKKRVRSFTLRAVTPLDDAEFESWRRPSQYTQRPEKYGIRPTQPAVARTSNPTNVYEKEVSYEPPRTPSPHDNGSIKSPSASVQKPERVRRKSSVCSSLADRPPTPYSPGSSTSEFPRSSYASRKSNVGSPRSHYPSMSEASAFHFNFHMDFDPHARDPARQSDDRPLNLSYGHGWHSDKV